jgi:hypothetical protein
VELRRIIAQILFFLILPLLISFLYGMIASNIFNNFMKSIPIDTTAIQVFNRVSLNVIGALLPFAVSLIFIFARVISHFPKKAYIEILGVTFLIYAMTSTLHSYDNHKEVRFSFPYFGYHLLGFFPAFMTYLLIFLGENSKLKSGLCNDWAKSIFASFSCASLSSFIIDTIYFLYNQWSSFQYGYLGMGDQIFLSGIDSIFYILIFLASAKALRHGMHLLLAKKSSPIP